MSGSGSAAPVIHPAVDVVTGEAAVVIQQRTVVPFTSWVADALRGCGATGRALQVVTGPGARLTAPLRFVLGGAGSRWVVRHTGGYYDGLSGAVLRWDGTSFAPALGADGSATYAEPFRRPPSVPMGPQLSITFRVRHQVTAATSVGGAVERLCRALTGHPPSGWGTSEPAARPWRTAELTSYCRERAPEPTWSMLVGEGDRPVIGTMLVSRTESGLEESVALLVGYRPDEDAPYAALAAAVDALAAAHHLVQLVVQQGLGPRDLTSVPHWVGFPVPIGLAVGPDGVRAAGRDRALNPPDATARVIGDPHDPAVWYALHDGPHDDGWPRFERLMQHLRP